MKPKYKIEIYSSDKIKGCFNVTFYMQSSEKDEIYDRVSDCISDEKHLRKIIVQWLTIGCLPKYYVI